MLKTCILFFAFFLFKVGFTQEKINYPSYKKGNFKEEIHNIVVSDPYRGLENLKEPETQSWFKSQSFLADSLLEMVPKERFLKKFLAFENSQKNLVRTYRIKENGNYFYLKKNDDGVEKLFLRRDKHSQETLLFDPEAYRKGHFIRYYKVSWDGLKVAIAISKKGEKESLVVVYDVNLEGLLEDVVEDLSPGHAGNLSWFPNNMGFFYTKVPHFRYDDKTYLLETEASYHLIGEHKKQRTIFSKNNNPTIPFQKGDIATILISNSSTSYLIGTLSNTNDHHDVYYAKINSSNNYDNIEWLPLFTKKEQIVQFFIKEDFLFFRTSKGASRYKICKTLLKNPNFNNPEVLISERDDSVISDFECLDGKVFFTIRKNGVKSKFFVKEKDSETEIKLPFSAGETSVFSEGKKLFVKVNGWTVPTSYFQYDYGKGILTNVSLDNGSYPEFEQIVVEEIEVKSHDGALVPVSILRKKELKKNGKSRAMLYTYGAYGISYSPRFFIPFVTWVSEGGVLVFPHVRGGGEKGNSWYEQGKKETKANTWLDLIATADYLIENNYTSKRYLINLGISAGGIAVGRAITERPDLFKVAIMDSPALNMVRYEFQPSGPNNVPEFGTIKDSTQFQALYEMDSYHHLETDVEYPSIMVKVGMKDGSVTPWDSAKFIAKAQNMTIPTNPVLFSVDFQGGHVGDGTVEGIYRNFSELYAFALWQTGHPEFQPKMRNR